MKAYQVLLPGETEGGFVAAETAGNARYRAFLAAQDANYDFPITKFRVLRAPDFDKWAMVETRPRCCFTLDYVQIQMRKLNETQLH